MNTIMLQEYPEVFFFACVGGLVIAFVSRAICERMTIISHLIVCGVVTGLIWPIVVHWVWSSKGWLMVGTETDSGQATYLVCIASDI